jgi:hypothetical protein
LNLPQKVFGDQTPRQACQQSEYQIPLLASLLIMELDGTRTPVGIDFNQMRSQLGLPLPAQTLPQGVAIDQFPVHRLLFLDTTGLDDEQLTTGFAVAASYLATGIMRKFGQEMLGREKLLESDQRVNMCLFMADTEDVVENAEKWWSAARQLCKDRKSEGNCLISELQWKLRNGDARRVGELIQQLTTSYSREEEVMQALHGLLMQHGLIRPDGTPVADAPAAAAAPEPASTLWTPDSPTPAPDQPAETKKSGLWIPD